jgi:hypothetical protein
MRPAIPPQRRVREETAWTERRALRPSADRQLPISIGQIPLTLHFSEDQLLHKADERYSRFRAMDGDALPVFLEAGHSPWPDVSRFAYTLDDASVRLGQAAAHFRGVRHEYALDSLIRVLLSVLLLPRRGFLLHAATVVREGRAYVFTGRSGAGKSTVASLSPPGSVLTDEISLLRFSGGAWHAYGTPFWGEFRADGSNRRVPLAGIYSLVQAPEDRVEPLAAREALRALLPNVLFFSSDQQQTDQLLSVLTSAAEQIPFYRLYFRRDAGFWEVIAP